jgi:hypothetical protein
MNVGVTHPFIFIITRLNPTMNPAKDQNRLIEKKSVEQWKKDLLEELQLDAPEGEPGFTVPYLDDYL